MKLVHRVWTPLLVAAVTLVLMLLTVAANDRLWHTERQSRLHDEAFRVASILERHLQRNLSVATLLGMLVRQYDGRLERFNDNARELLTAFEGVTNLQLAPDGVINAIYPLTEPHQQALGHNILRSDSSRNTAWVAINTRTLTLAGPMTLVQGGQGMLARQPVFVGNGDDERFWGFASALIMMDDFIAATPLSKLENTEFAYRLTRQDPHGNSSALIAGSKAALQGFTERVAVQLPNQVWTLELGWTTAQTLAPYTPYQIILSSIIAALAGVLTFFRLSHPRKLKHSLQQQAQRSEQLQQALTHERDRARDYLDNLSQTLLLVTDLQGNVILLNRFGYQLLDYPLDTLTGDNWSRRCIPEKRIERAEAFFAGMENQPLGYQTQGELPLLCRNGDQRLLSWNCTVVKGNDQQLNLLFVAQDITHQRAAENHLLKLSRAVEQSSTCVVMLHRSGYIEYVNPSFTRLTGFSAAEAIGRKPRFLECDQTDRQQLLALRREVARGHVWQGELCYRRKNDTLFWARESVSPITSETGEITHFVSVLEDISNQRAHQQEIERLAYYDQLTGIGNRRHFRRQLNELLDESGDQPVALLHIDLDHFKRVNELLGHEAGDQLLVRVADKLQREVGHQGQVARISGDEFLIALCDTDRNLAESIAKRLLRELRLPTWLGSDMVRSHEVLISASIGIAVADEQTRETCDLLQCADLAMNHAKKRGGNHYRHFNRRMVEEVQANLALEKELHRAVKEQEFVLYFQPQLDLESGRVCGLEALIRWQHPTRGMIYPDQFIPLAEEAGLIVAIGQQVIRQACETWRRLADSGNGHLNIAVNLSALQFRDPLFISTFRHILSETRTPPERIELELTESMLMTNIDEAITLLQQLKQLGCSLAIDDFGTGYSSLNYLKQLPVDVLKIDRSFVKDIPTDNDDKAITAAVIAMAHKLQLAVVAEGVEEEPQQQFLRDNGCQLAQGYLYSPPVAEAQLATVIARIEADQSMAALAPTAAPTGTARCAG
ncbi:bifunctional diguanylate cyclase/phosphodiesterase [Motiliproteus sediminis]|uniref:bifunctional diguanylate cyclase/phosphodiesterase n=1 Tax=Motiliproteus sediminis TaxID=1468178 RepID=UPI001AEF4A32|nr:EAL domain-containing protein [Motiliproteus sediminis]